MPEFLIIYRLHQNWPLTGEQNFTKTETFDFLDPAKLWIDAMWNEWSDCKDLQLYEYNGVQYVLVERRHRDA